MSEPQSPEQPNPSQKNPNKNIYDHTSRAENHIKKGLRKGILSKITGILGVNKGLEQHAARTEMTNKLKVDDLSFSLSTSQAESDQLKKLARVDSLTELPNRRWLMERLTEEISHSERTNIPCAVLFFDADGFKRINDEYSHLAGDEVLKLMASLSHRKDEPIARVGDTKALDKDQNTQLVRLGGDEFVLLIREFKNIQQIKSIMRRFSSEFMQKSTQFLASSTPNQKYNPKDVIKESTLSMGVAIFQEGDTAQKLLDRADSAMYRTKNSEGKGKDHGFIKNADGTFTELFFDPKKDYFASITNDERGFIEGLTSGMEQLEVPGTIQAINDPITSEGNADMLSLYLTIDKDTGRENDLLTTTKKRFEYYERIVKELLAELPGGFNYSIEPVPPEAGRGNVAVLNDGSFIIRSDNPNIRPIEIITTPERRYSPRPAVQAIELANTQ